MGFDETGKDGYDYITCNIKLRKPNGDTRTLCLRGAFLTDGKTVAQEAAALKDYFPGHGRTSSGGGPSSWRCSPRRSAPSRWLERGDDARRGSQDSG